MPVDVGGHRLAYPVGSPCPILRRRSPPMRTIRGKLLIGIGGLSAAMVLLAGSLVAALGRYSHMADQISARAMRLSPASELPLAVDRVRAANRRWCDGVSGGGMLHAGGLLGESGLTVRRAGVSAAVLDLQFAMQRYGRTLQPGDRSIEPLVARIDAVDRASSQPAMMSVDPVTRDNLLAMQLTELSESTSRHVARLHRSIAGATESLRADFRGGVTLAGGVFAVVLIGVAILVAYLHVDVLQPFRLLVDGCRLIASEQQYDMRLDLGRDDELGALAAAMNQMTDRFQSTCQSLRMVNVSLNQAVRDRSDEVIRNEQLASVGFLAAGFAHEINNPMATIAWSAESLERRVEEWQTDLSDDKHADMFEQLGTGLRRIGGEAFRCSDITKSMLDLSRLSDCQRGRRCHRAAGPRRRFDGRGGRSVPLQNDRSARATYNSVDER